jgi:hypothetical protein
MLHLLVLAISVLALWVASADAATIFVDSDCTAVSTYNPATQSCSTGADIVKPTIAAALAASGCGDTINVRDGTYTEAMLSSFPTNCTALTRLTVQGYLTERPILRPTSGQRVVGFDTNDRFITIRHFDMDSVNVEGDVVKIDPGTTTPFPVVEGITLEDNIMRNANGPNAGACMKSSVYSSGTTFRRNHLINCGTTDISVYGVKGHGIYWAGANGIIEYNLIENSNNLGIQLFYNSGGTTPNNNTIFRFNRVTGSQGIGVWVSNGTNMKIYGNIIDNNGLHGLYISHEAVNADVYNNTLYRNNAIAANAGHIRIHQNATGVVRNNVVHRGGSPGRAMDLQTNGVTGMTIGANTCDGDDPEALCASVRDPLLVNPAAGDFSLQSTSAEVTAGTAQVPYCEAPCDRGAHQVIAVESGVCSGNSFVLNFRSRGTLAGTTTFSNARVAGVARTLSAPTITGAKQLTQTISGAVVVAAEACLLDFAQGTLNDCRDIGRGVAAECAGHAQKMFTVANIPLTNASTPAVLTPVTFVFERFGRDRGTWRAPPLKHITAASPSLIHVCAGFTATINAEPAQSYVWFVAKNGPVYVAVPTTCDAATGACLANDAQLAPGVATLDNLGGTFAGGTYISRDVPLSSVALAINTQANICGVIQIAGGLTAGDTLAFRIRRANGTTLNSYPAIVTPTVTIGVDETSFN